MSNWPLRLHESVDDYLYFGKQIDTIRVANDFNSSDTNGKYLMVREPFFENDIRVLRNFIRCETIRPETSTIYLNLDFQVIGIDISNMVPGANGTFVGNMTEYQLEISRTDLLNIAKNHEPILKISPIFIGASNESLPDINFLLTQTEIFSGYMSGHHILYFF